MHIYYIRQHSGPHNFGRHSSIGRAKLIVKKGRNVKAKVKVGLERGIAVHFPMLVEGPCGKIHDDVRNVGRLKFANSCVTGFLRASQSIDLYSSDLRSQSIENSLEPRFNRFNPSYLL